MDQEIKNMSSIQYSETVMNSRESFSFLDEISQVDMSTSASCECDYSTSFSRKQRMKKGAMPGQMCSFCLNASAVSLAPQSPNQHFQREVDVSNSMAHNITPPTSEERRSNRSSLEYSTPTANFNRLMQDCAEENKSFSKDRGKNELANPGMQDLKSANEVLHSLTMMYSAEKSSRGINASCLGRIPEHEEQNTGSDQAGCTLRINMEHSELSSSGISESPSQLQSDSGDSSEVTLEEFNRLKKLLKNKEKELEAFQHRKLFSLEDKVALETLNHENERLKRELASVTRKNDSLEKRMVALASDFETEKMSLRNDYSKQLEKLHTDNVHLQTALNSLRQHEMWLSSFLADLNSTFETDDFSMIDISGIQDALKIDSKPINILESFVDQVKVCLTKSNNDLGAEKKALSRAQQEIIAFKRDLELLYQQNTQLKKTITVTEQANIELKEQVSCAGQDAMFAKESESKAQASAAKWEREVNRLQAGLKQLAVDNQQTKLQLSKAEEQVFQLTEENESLKENYRKAQNEQLEKRNLQTIISEKQEKLSQYMEELTEKRLEMERLKNQLQSERALNTSEKQERITFERRCQELVVEVERTKRTLHSAETTIRGIEEERKQTTKKNAGLEDHCRSLQKVVEEMKRTAVVTAKAHEGKIRHLEASLADTEKKLAQCKESEGAFADIQRRLTESHESVTQEKMILEGRLSSLETGYQSVQARLDTVSQQLLRTKEDNKSLQAAKAEMQKVIDNKSMKEEETLSELRKLQKECLQLREELDSSERRFQEKSTAYNSKLQILSDLKLRVINFEQEAETFRQEKSSLEKRLKAQNTKNQQEIQHLKDELEASRLAKQHLVNQEDENHSLKLQIKDLESQLGESRSDRDRKIEELRQIRLTCSKIETELFLKNEQSKKSAQKEETTQAKLEELEIALREHRRARNDELANKDKDLASQQRELVELRSLSSRMQENIDQLEKENLLVKKKLHESNTQQAALEFERKKLQETISQKTSLAVDAVFQSLVNFRDSALVKFSKKVEVALSTRTSRFQTELDFSSKDFDSTEETMKSFKLSIEKLKSELALTLKEVEHLFSTAAKMLLTKDRQIEEINAGAGKARRDRVDEEMERLEIKLRELHTLKHDNARLRDIISGRAPTDEGVMFKPASETCTVPRPSKGQRRQKQSRDDVAGDDDNLSLVQKDQRTITALRFKVGELESQLSAIRGKVKLITATSRALQIALEQNERGKVPTGNQNAQNLDIADIEVLLFSQLHEIVAMTEGIESVQAGNFSTNKALASVKHQHSRLSSLPDCAPFLEFDRIPEYEEPCDNETERERYWRNTATVIKEFYKMKLQVWEAQIAGSPASIEGYEASPFSRHQTCCQQLALKNEELRREKAKNARLEHQAELAEDFHQNNQSGGSMTSEQMPEPRPLDRKSVVPTETEKSENARAMMLSRSLQL